MMETAQQMARGAGVDLAGISQLDRGEQDRRWRCFYEDSFRGIYQLLVCLGVERAEIEDLIQRVFLIAHQKVLGGVDVRYPRAWLRGIAVRIVSEHRRWYRVRQAKRWLLEASPAETSRDSRGPEEQACSGEVAQQVRATLGRLSPRLRDVLVLVDLEDCSLDQTAALLGIPKNTVRSRRSKARREFARMWKRYVENEVCHGHRK